MKIAISTLTASMDAELDPRFGRAQNYVIVDSETEEWEAVANPAVSAGGGAGIQAAQFVANQGVKAVISGAFGPNAFNTLGAAGIEMYTAPNGTTARDLLAQFKDGKLNQLDTASHGGYHDHGGRRGMSGGRGMGRGRG